MYKLLTKHGQLLAFGTGLIVILIFIINVTSGISGFNALSKEDQYNSTIFDLGIVLTIALLVICLVIMIVFALYQTITHPKAAIKGLIALGALIVLVGVLYSMAVPETTGPIAESAKEFNLTDNQSKMVSAGIRATMLLGAVAILAFIYSEIRNLFK